MKDRDTETGRQASFRAGINRQAESETEIKRGNQREREREFQGAAKTCAIFSCKLRITHKNTGDDKKTMKTTAGGGTGSAAAAAAKPRPVLTTRLYANEHETIQNKNERAT